MELSTENIAAVTAAVIAAMSNDTSESGVQVEAPTAKPKATGRARAKGASQSKASSRKPKNVVACITAGDAWTMLGADEKFKPGDLDKPANNGQLWRLNAAGLLKITQ